MKDVLRTLIAAAPLGWRLLQTVGGSPKKALEEIRRIELEQRAAQDARMQILRKIQS
jgi:hypothetical protein